MKFKIDKGLLPIKAHFFFFFAALGPILPQINVFGKQLGVSPAAMGMVTAVLPLLWAVAKPMFGYVVDFWPAHRKLIFMLLIVVMTGTYCGLWFLPMPDEPVVQLQYVYKFNDTVSLRRYDNTTSGEFLKKYNCHWNCNLTNNFDIYMTNSSYINTVFIEEQVSNSSCSLLHMDFNDWREGGVVCVPRANCNLICFEDELHNSTRKFKREVNDNSTADKNNRITDANKMADKMAAVKMLENGNDTRNIDNIYEYNVTETLIEQQVDSNFYKGSIFWSFVVLSCIGTVAFNVANCIGDAVCFDVLGPDRGSKYGAQRAWGTVGYGITALLGGWLTDVISVGTIKDFTPAFIVALVCTVIDLYSCRKLKLPSLSSPEDSGKALRKILKIPKVVVFIIFAVVAGIFDSFIIYYMFWFLEELAEETGYMSDIKLIEGIVIASQCLIGELLFFFFSGKIIDRFGYGHTLTISLFFYGVRMACISLITSPWHLVLIETVTQGPTYALCYATIVGYAAHVAPEGYSATVQGIVAGMDDGVGFAVGSLAGGLVYGAAGGRGSFRLFGGVALLAAAAHAVLYALVHGRERRRLRAAHVSKPPAEVEVQEEDEKMLPDQNFSNAIYNDTVISLKDVKANR